MQVDSSMGFVRLSSSLGCRCVWATRTLASRAIPVQAASCF